MVNIGKYSDIVTLWNIVEDITMKYIDQTLQVFLLFYDFCYFFSINKFAHVFIQIHLLYIFN